MTRWLCRADRTNAAIVKKRLVWSVQALSFIKNRVVWSGSIHGAMQTIPGEYYRWIIAGGV